MKKYLLELIVFLCGAVVMILELTGSRVLAPFVGNSLAVWTALIGIILASLSVGYYSGGKVADKYPTFRAFSLVIFGSGAAVGLTALAHSEILPIFQKVFTDVRVNAVVSAAILFAPASVLLGMVSPYAVKLRVRELESSGATVGRLYAISTVGSIVGTFLSGFFLLSYFGTSGTLYGLAITLLGTSLLAFGGSMLRLRLAVFALFGSALAATVVFDRAASARGYIDTDTAYSRVIIGSATDPVTGRPIRFLATDADAVQSAMFTDADSDLVLPYTKFYRLVGHFRPDVKSALTIGGGAYSYPKDFLQKFPNATMDVVEIDPELTALARRYFNLGDSPRLAIIHEDGRTYLNREPKTYDAIFIDAFRSYTPPFQLTTKEAIRHAYNMLDEDGVVLANIISAVTGDNGKFLRAQYRTFAEIFPQVYVFPVQEAGRGDQVQNVLLVALKSKKPMSMESADAELNIYLSQRWTQVIPYDSPSLTDDYAPVERYAPKIRK